MSNEHSNNSGNTLIVYSEADQEFAIRLRDDLVDSGLHVTIGPSPAVGLNAWQSEFLRLLQDANILLVCTSAAAADDKSFREQLGIATHSSQKKDLVLIRLNEYPHIDELRHATQIVNGQDYNRTVPLLIRHLSTGGRELPRPVTPPHPPAILLPIDQQTLTDAAAEAEAKLTELKHATGAEHSRLINEEALVGDLPRWYHLYMGAYGAFRRPRKETQILRDLEVALGKLAAKKHGLLLHVISGDSGCGKSTLARQLIRRFIQQEELHEFPDIARNLERIRFFELQDLRDPTKILNEANAVMESDPDAEIYFIYVDDLFVFEDADIDKLLQTLKLVSDKTAIYLFATSPNWIFDARSDLAEKKKTFQLIDSIETRIGGIDPSDRAALKEQYLEMHGEDVRLKLLAELDRAGEVLILYKLALHHNQGYSEYFNRLFTRLEEREPRYLAALLLFSTLSRFYVHFPLTLVEELNKELEAENKLPEEWHDYEKENESGLRLFRVRLGTRGRRNPQGMPDTVAPFHDRVAQVIYDTWGENRWPVPCFNVKLKDLKIKVYSKLNQSNRTRPILSNVFRGHLRVAGDQELRQFVDRFGPVQGGDWTLTDDPIAALRWVKYSRYERDRTHEFRREWAWVLSETAKQSPNPKISLILAVLRPAKLRDDPSFKKHILAIKLTNLNNEYFGVLRGVLDGFLSSFPLPLDSLAAYLSQLREWLNRPSRARRIDSASETEFLSDPLPQGSVTARYLIVSSLTESTWKIFSRLRAEDPLNKALTGMVKDYLSNLAHETSTNEILGRFGLLKLNERINWRVQDVAELTQSLFAYLNDKENAYRPAVFEHLVTFALLGNHKDPTAITKLFLDICKDNAEFAGLTYTARAFWTYVRNIVPSIPVNIPKQILEDLTAGKLAPIEASVVYPDLAKGLIRRLVAAEEKGSPDQLLALLRPLVTRFGNNVETPYVFHAATRLDSSFLESFPNSVQDPTTRQIRLCFAQGMGLRADYVVSEFIDLLEHDQIKIPHTVAPLLKRFLDSKSDSSIAPDLLTEYRDRFYSRLRAAQNRDDGAAYFTLTNALLFFSPTDLEGLGKLAAKNIRLIPQRLHAKHFPFKFLWWWLDRAKTSPELLAETRLILDAFWHFALNNCELEHEDKFVIYDSYFLRLLPRYGLALDEEWWAKAVTELMQQISRSLGRKTSRAHSRRKHSVNSKIVLYKQRQCLEKMLDGILKQFMHQRNTLKGEFSATVEKLFARHRDQPWLHKWFPEIAPQATIDVTDALIEYVNSLRADDANVFDIKDRVGWWYAWLHNLPGDLALEIDRIAEWFENRPSKGTAIFFLTALLERMSVYDPMRQWGSLVLRLIEDSQWEFSDKSLLVHDYLNYVKNCAGTWKSDVSAEEFKVVVDIATWYLHAARRKRTLQFTAFGLQKIFDVAFVFNLSLDVTLASEAFSDVCSAQMGYQEGGATANYSFPGSSDKARRLMFPGTLS
jgi:hypothetical protein